MPKLYARVPDGAAPADWERNFVTEVHDVPQIPRTGEMPEVIRWGTRYFVRRLRIDGQPPKSARRGVGEVVYVEGFLWHAPLT